MLPPVCVGGKPECGVVCRHRRAQFRIATPWRAVAENRGVAANLLAALTRS
jgi:hypothetical protein